MIDIRDQRESIGSGQRYYTERIEAGLLPFPGHQHGSRYDQGPVVVPATVDASRNSVTIRADIDPGEGMLTWTDQD